MENWPTGHSSLVAARAVDHCGTGGQMRVQDILGEFWETGKVLGDYWCSDLLAGGMNIAIHIPSQQVIHFDPSPSVMPIENLVAIYNLKSKDDPLLEKKPFNLIEDLESYILANAQYRHTAFAALNAQMLVSVLAAPEYVSPIRQGKLNQFHLIIGESGCGKNDYLFLIEKILDEVFQTNDWNHGEPQSKSALQMCMVRKNFGSIFLSEGFNFLNSKPGDTTYGCSKLLMNTWASDGSLAELPTKNFDNFTPQVKRPQLCTLMEMIPDDFNEALTNRDVIKGGLIQRCSWAKEDRPLIKTKKNILDDTPEEILSKLRNISTELLLKASQFSKEFDEWVMMPKRPPMSPRFKTVIEKKTVHFGEGSEHLFDIIASSYRNLSNEYSENYKALSTIYVRSPEKIMRMACGSAIYEQAYESEKVLLPRHLDAAHHFEMAAMEHFRDTFKEYEHANEHERIREKLMQQMAVRPVRIRDFRRSVSVKDSRVIDTVMNQLKSDGVAMETVVNLSKFLQFTEKEESK
jgi:hypothetical protein